MKNKIYIINAALLLIIFIVASPLHAIDYYVDQTHANSSDQNTGSIERPWETITKANQTLIAGDTVYIKAGTYSSYITPANSGTSSSPITYKSFGTDSVIVSDTVQGIFLSGKSHIIVQGIHFYNLDRFLWLDNASHNIIAYCNFERMRNYSSWSGSKIYRSSRYNWVHHCQFSKWGYYTNDDKGCVLDIGNENTRTDLTSYNLLENSIFFHGGHHILGVYGMNNVIRNNYFNNEPWSIGTTASDRGAVMYGNRNLSVAGYAENSGRNLIERNRIAFASDPPDNIGASGMSLTTSNNIVRFNSFYHNVRAGLSMTLTRTYWQNIRHNKIYNNSFMHNGFYSDDYDDHSNAGISLALYSGSNLIEDNVLKNNIFYNHRKVFDAYVNNHRIPHISRSQLIKSQIYSSNWDGDTQGNPYFVKANANLNDADPMDIDSVDLRLKSNSPCIDAGTYLTTISSTNGSGITFRVADAGYFMDGWGIVQGDEIQLYGSLQKARITNINYSTNIITVDRNLAWTQNQGVSLVYEGSAPDIGAYEFLQAPSPSPSTN